MTKKEFNEFSLNLPRQYQERFERMGTFEKMSGNKDVILLEDFAQTLDIFAEMQANDCDIDFEIRQTKQPRKMKPAQSLIKRRTEYFNKKQQSAILKFVEDHRKSINDGNNNNNNNIMDYRQSQLKLSHLVTSSITDDDREYDNDLLRYQTQIVITRRTTPGQRFIEYGGSVSNSKTMSRETTLSVIMSGEAINTSYPPSIKAKDISTIDLYNDEYKTPSSSKPTTPGFAGRDNWHRRGIVFDANPLIKDISGYHDKPMSVGKRRKRTESNADDNGDIRNKPPNIDEMSTQSIDNHDFTDSHMNIFMTSLTQKNQRKY